MPLHIFSDRNRAGSYVIMLCLAAAMFATFFFITQFVQNVLGYSPLKAGFAFLPMTIGIGGTANIISRLVGRIGTRRPMTVGPLLVARGLLWLSFVGVHAAYLSVMGPLLLLAIGMGSTFVPLTLTVMSRVPAGRGRTGLRACSTPVSRSAGHSGLAVLVTVATSVTRSHLASAGHTVSHAQHSLATTSGYDAAFRLGSVIAFVAFILAVTVIRGTNRMPAAMANVECQRRARGRRRLTSTPPSAHRATGAMDRSARGLERRCAGVPDRCQPQPLDVGDGNRAGNRVHRWCNPRRRVQRWFGRRDGGSGRAGDRGGGNRHGGFGDLDAGRDAARRQRRQRSFGQQIGTGCGEGFEVPRGVAHQDRRSAGPGGRRTRHPEQRTHLAEIVARGDDGPQLFGAVVALTHDLDLPLLHHVDALAP